MLGNALYDSLQGRDTLLLPAAGAAVCFVGNEAWAVGVQTRANPKERLETQKKRLEQIKGTGRAFDTVKAVDPVKTLELFVAPEANPTGPQSLGFYVPRPDVDAELDRRLQRPAEPGKARVAAIVGPPKAGKSRTLWEAVARNLSDHAIFVLGDPETEPLSKLLSLEDHAELTPDPSRLVFWIDDAHNHLLAGLNNHNLKQLAESFPGCAIALAFTTGITDRPWQLPSSLHESQIRLDPQLGAEQIKTAQTHFPGFTAGELKFLPERLAGIDQLWQRYQKSVDGEPPTGWAFVRVAHDWHRLGAGPGIPLDDLISLARVLLIEE